VVVKQFSVVFKHEQKLLPAEICALVYKLLVYIAGSRCGTGSCKVERNDRNLVNKVTDDGQRLSSLRALRKKKMWRRTIGRSKQWNISKYEGRNALFTKMGL
jgi:hypothetical protein